MMLREVKQLKGPKGVSNDELLHDENVETVENELSAASRDVNDGNDVPNSNEVPKDPKYFLKSYTPPLPFPHRMAKVKLDMQFRKCLEILKKIYINIPFTDALSRMPLLC